MYRVDFADRCIPILNAAVLLVTSVKTKSYQKNRMLRWRDSYELERVLFPRNRLLQPIARAISILRRAVPPQFLGISRNCNCKNCAHFTKSIAYRIYVTFYIRLIISAFTISVIDFREMRILFPVPFLIIKIVLLLYILLDRPREDESRKTRIENYYRDSENIFFSTSRLLKNPSLGQMETVGVVPNIRLS